MPDLYDKEIERLTKTPKDIKESWARGTPLFRFLSRNKMAKKLCGCLVTVKAHRTGDSCMVESAVEHKLYGKKIPDTEYFYEYDKELAAEIAADVRLPTTPENIGLRSLPVFAEWQRKMDVYYGRTPENY